MLNGPQASVTDTTAAAQEDSASRLTVRKSELVTPADIRQELYTQGLPDGIRFMKPGDSKMTAANGYNPDDYVEVVLEDSHDLCALTLMLEQVHAMTRSAIGDKARLFHVFGECHAMSAHIMAQACFAATLPGCLYGHEAPANGLAVEAQKNYGVDLSGLSLKELQEVDPNGHLYAEALRKMNFSSAPLARNHLITAILRGGGSWVNMDAMRKDNEYYIDECDPLLAKMADKVFPGEDLDLTKIPTFPRTSEHDSTGYILRNFIMACRAFDAAIRHEVLDIVIGIGASHLGVKPEGVAHEQSLPAALLREATERGEEDAQVISFFPPIPTGEYLPHVIIPPGREAGHIPLIVHGQAEDMHPDLWAYPPGYMDRFANSFYRAGKFDHPALRMALSPYKRDIVRQIKTELQALAPR